MVRDRSNTVRDKRNTFRERSRRRCRGRSMRIVKHKGRGIGAGGWV